MRGLGGHAGRKATIDKTHELPVPRQAKALKLSRGSIDDLRRPVPAADLAIVGAPSCDAWTRCISHFLLSPPKGAGRRMRRDLRNAEGFETGRLHVVTLMKRMAIYALTRTPNTRKPTP